MEEKKKVDYEKVVQGRIDKNGSFHAQSYSPSVVQIDGNSNQHAAALSTLRGVRKGISSTPGPNDLSRVNYFGERKSLDERVQSLRAQSPSNRSSSVRVSRAVSSNYSTQANSHSKRDSLKKKSSSVSFEEDLSQQSDMGADPDSPQNGPDLVSSQEEKEFEELRTQLGVYREKGRDSVHRLQQQNIARMQSQTRTVLGFVSKLKARSNSRKQEREQIVRREKGPVNVPAQSQLLKRIGMQCYRKNKERSADDLALRRKLKMEEDAWTKSIVSKFRLDANFENYDEALMEEVKELKRDVQSDILVFSSARKNSSVSEAASSSSVDAMGSLRQVSNVSASGIVRQKKKPSDKYEGEQVIIFYDGNLGNGGRAPFLDPLNLGPFQENLVAMLSHLPISIMSRSRAEAEREKVNVLNANKLYLEFQAEERGGHAKIWNGLEMNDNGEGENTSAPGAAAAARAYRMHSKAARKENVTLEPVIARMQVRQRDFLDHSEFGRLLDDESIMNSIRDEQRAAAGLRSRLEDEGPSCQVQDSLEENAAKNALLEAEINQVSVSDVIDRVSEQATAVRRRSARSTAEERMYVAIRVAIVEGDFDTFLQMLEHEDIDETMALDPEGNTLLHFCCAFCRLEMAQYLVQRGRLKVNARTKAGWTALHYAASVNHVPMVQMLCQAGASPMIFNNSGVLPASLSENEKVQNIMSFARKDAFFSGAFTYRVEGDLFKYKKLEACVPATFEIISLDRNKQPVASVPKDFIFNLGLRGVANVTCLSSKSCKVGNEAENSSREITYAHQFQIAITESGKYFFSVKFKGEYVFGCPFPVEVYPGQAEINNTLVSGMGLAEAKVGLSSQFTLQMRDQRCNRISTGGATFEIRLESENGGVRSIVSDAHEVVDHRNGSYTIRYLLQTAGTCRMFVSCAGKSIPGSPFFVTVNPAATSSFVSHVRIEGELTSYAKEKSSFMVYSKDMMDNSCHDANNILKVFFYESAILDKADRMLDVRKKLRDPTSNPTSVLVGTGIRPVSSDIVEWKPLYHGEGEYEVTFTLHEIGKYDVVATLAGFMLIGCPFVVNCMPSVAAGKQCIVDGTGIRRHAAGTEVYLNILLRDSGGNMRGKGGDSLHIAVLPKKAGVNIPEVQCTDHQDGSYNAVWRPMVAGEYAVAVMIHEHHVGASPFKRIVCEPSDVDFTQTLFHLELEDIAPQSPNAEPLWEDENSFPSVEAGAVFKGYITSKDEFGNIRSYGGDEFQVDAVLLNETPLETKISDLKNGKYKIQVKTSRTSPKGEATLNITIPGGQDILHSPFRFRVI